MKTQHTQGPWEYDYFGEHVSFAGNDARKDYTFRVEYCATMSDAEKVANSNLIASAPELLSALQEAVKCLSLHGNPGIQFSNEATQTLIQSARAAIAKATGGEE